MIIKFHQKISDSNFDSARMELQFQSECNENWDELFGDEWWEKSD